jgi:hypothetical protein
VIRLILFVFLIVLFVMVVRRVLAKQSPAVAVTARGVGLRGWRSAWSMDWSDIRQIDVVRMPNVGAERFCVVLFANSTLSVYDHYRGYGDFAAAMFNRWPAIRAEWMRVFAGPQDISERVTVWRRDKG